MQLVQQAIAARGWLIIVFHDFTTGTPANRYQFPAGDVAKLVGLIASSGIEVVPVGEGVKRIACP